MTQRRRREQGKTRSRCLLPHPFLEAAGRCRAGFATLVFFDAHKGDFYPPELGLRLEIRLFFRCARVL
jgi:hypothetical protein